MKTKLMLVLAPALCACAITAAPAAAKGLNAGGAPNGVALPGSPHRYVALSAGLPGKPTLVARVSREGGRVDRWWRLPDSYFVPAVAYDGSGGGLSADGGTLVLNRFSRVYPPAVTRLAILNTHRDARRTGEVGTRGAIRYLSLRGDFNFDAISPDGSTVYLTHHYLPPSAGNDYIPSFEVRALEVASGRLLPEPIVDPSNPDGRMEGLPITRAYSLDGRWAYTLYDGNGDVPFLRALNTVTGRAVRLDLPQLRERRTLFLIRMRAESDGDLVLRRRSTVQSNDNLRPVLSIDTKTFEVRPAEPRAVASAWRSTLMRAWGTAVGILAGQMASPGRASVPPGSARGRFLAFASTSRRPGNSLGRVGVAGRSAEGRPIPLRQFGDPAVAGSVLVFGCVHGDECAARKLEPRFVRSGGCPDPRTDLLFVRNLDPDGLADGARLNGRGVDLNRNFPVGWKPLGERGDPEFSGPRPFSEPETRLAARIVREVDPEATIWFHQHHGQGAYVRAWGQSAPLARRFARLGHIPFRLLPWLAGTAPNWQNRRFPGTASFVVELPAGELDEDLGGRLGAAIVLLGREVGED